MSEQGDEAQGRAAQQPEQALSLTHEINTIEEAISGALILNEAIRMDQLPEDTQIDRALAGVAGILSLVSCRLAEVGRACSGFLDPRRLTASHNLAVGDDVEGDEARLVPWSLARRHAELTRELRVVEEELAGEGDDA